MTSRISNVEAESQLSKILCNGSIDKLTYNVTSWELRFVLAKGQYFCVTSAEIELPNIESWWDAIGNTPVSLNETNEPNDTIVAMCLFTAINRWPVNLVKIDKQGNLLLSFSNGCLVNLLAIVEPIDWTWQVKAENSECAMTCDSGDIYITNEWSKMLQVHV